MTIKNNTFNHLSINYIFIDKDINEWSIKNNVILIPFQNKYLNNISKIIWEATYKTEMYQFDTGRDWEEKIIDMNVKGKPDYFAFKYHGGNWEHKRIEFYFLEYKTLSDSLHYNQIMWFRKYHKLPCMVIHSTTKGKIDIKHFKKSELNKVLRGNGINP